MGYGNPSTRTDPGRIVHVQAGAVAVCEPRGGGKPGVIDFMAPILTGVGEWESRVAPEQLERPRELSVYASRCLKVLRPLRDKS